MDREVGSRKGKIHCLAMAAIGHEPSPPVVKLLSQSCRSRFKAFDDKKGCGRSTRGDILHVMNSSTSNFVIATGSDRAALLLGLLLLRR